MDPLIELTIQAEDIARAARLAHITGNPYIAYYLVGVLNDLLNYFLVSQTREKCESAESSKTSKPAHRPVKVATYGSSR